jgi:hypothetical protein
VRRPGLAVFDAAAQCGCVDRLEVVDVDRDVLAQRRLRGVLERCSSRSPTRSQAVGIRNVRLGICSRPSNSV